MKMIRLMCVGTCLLALTAGVRAQDAGYWRAMSTTARSITGDINIGEIRVTIDFTAYAIAQIRVVKPEEAAAVFAAGKAPGAGNLYRLSVPGEKKFLHHNSLCGGDETQWMVTYAVGKELSVAFFSGASMPVLKTEDILNTTALCGTYTYMR